MRNEKIIKFVFHPEKVLYLDKIHENTFFCAKRLMTWFCVDKKV